MPEEKTPEEKAEAVSAAAKKIDLKKAFHRLANPAVAARIGLTDQQRAEVQRLLTLRSQELAKAPEEKWAEVIEKSEQQLADVLTPAQKAIWPKVFEEKTVRITFRMQSWSDVLYWIAEQLGLQLVMDAPPPGTLNYADQRDYTPAEAIDILNSVLQTKGYTLIRNDRMLMLFDLKRGQIPIQFLPKLKPEDLPDRGRFEYTTVVFPLERRVRADVMQAITPFKGTYCKVVPMPGNSLMITDTASTLLVLQKVIESVENPPAPAVATPATPTPTVWKTYKIEKNDPTKIETIFKEFAPTAKLLRIGNSREIHVQLPEAEQPALEKILEMLEMDSGLPEGEPILATYSLEMLTNVSPQQSWRIARRGRALTGTTAVSPASMYNPYNPYDPAQTIGKEIIDILKQTFPAAVVSETPAANNVVVLAPKADQEKIKAFFESLKQVSSPEDDPVVKLYKFADKNKRMNDETLKQLRSVVPAASLSLDDQQGQILIVATAKEHEMITKAVAELEAAALPEEGKFVVTYPMSASVATRFTALFRQLIQKKELEGAVNLHDTKQNQITIWATAAQHDIIRKAADELSGRKETPKGAGGKSGEKSSEPVLAVFPLDYAYAYTTQAMLGNIIPNAEFSYDPRTNAVVAHATPDVLEVVKKAITELDKGTGSDVAFITLKREIPADIMRQITRTAPTTIVVQSRRSLQVIATGPKAELDKIKAVLTASEAAIPVGEQMIVHSFNNASPQTAVAVLAELFPELHPTINAVNNQIIVQVHADQKEPVTSLLTQLDGDLDFVPLKKEISAEMLASFRTLAPRATVVVDKENSQAMIQGSKPDVDKIRKIIESSEKTTAIPEEVYVHTFKSAYPYYVVAILREVYPEVKVAGYPTNNQLAVRFRPELKEKILKLFNEIDGDIVFIPLKKELSPDLLARFPQIAPYANVVVDKQNLQAMVYGPKSEVERIRAIITSSEAAAPVDEEIYVHTFKSASPNSVAVVLREVYPEVRVVGNPTERQLMLRIRPEIKEKVQKLLDDMDGDIVFLPLKKELSPETTGVFSRVAPAAVVIEDKKNSLAMVYGTKPDVEKIQKIITTMEASTAVEEEVYVHTFRTAYPYYVTSILREVYPEVKVAGYPTHNQLAVRFRPELKEKILKLFEEVDGDIVFIPLKKDIPPEILARFPGIAPYAQVVVDQKNSQAMIYGPKPEVERIRKIIETSEAAATIEEEVYVHTFKSIPPYYAAPVIQQIYPEVRIAGYPTGNQLMLRLRPEMKEKVVKLFDEMDGDVVFIPLKKELSPEIVSAFPRVAPYAVVIVDKQNSLAMVYGSKPDVEKIQKMITTSESALPLSEDVIVHNLKNVEAETVLPILREIHPDVKIKDDPENNRIVIRVRPDKTESIKSLLAQLDAADPEKDKRFFKSYTIDTAFYSMTVERTRYTPLNFVRDLQKLTPKAKLSFDENSQQLIVWGTEEEHRIIDAAVKNLQGDANAKKFGRFQLRRAYPYTIIPIVQRMFPTVISTYDYYTGTIIVEGHPKLIDKVQALLEAIDPAEPSPSDPVVRFYTLNAEPSPSMVQGLQRLVPTALIVPEKEAKQIMVVAKPDEQKMIEGNVHIILSTYVAPEENMLFIYPATQEQRDRLESFIKTAAKDLKGVAIVPDKIVPDKTGAKPINQISIWAKPSEHQLIAAILKQMSENQANEPVRQLKVFQMSIGDLVTAQELLKVSHPEATLFVDKTGNRLLVWATLEELEKVTQTLTAQGNLDNRQMLAYPVAGAKPETLMKVIQDVFNGLKITPELQSRRILVWASPEEHVKVAEIVEQTNKKEDPNSELAEKFVAYSAAQLDPPTILKLFKALIPDADVYGDVAADKITVRARVREHVQIKELLEQLRQKDDKLRPILNVYPFGDTDPVMIEAMLRAQLPNAESMTPDDVVERLSFWFAYERSPWYRNYYGRSGPKKIGYFKVDPQTQSVFVFVNGEDQVEVEKAMKQIVAAGNQEGIKPVVRRYSLDEMSYYDVYSLVRQVAPSAVFTEVYTYTPPPEGGGRYNYMMNYRDFLAYTREAEHIKIEALVKELNDRAGVGKKEMLSITLPEGSKYPRQQIIETVRKLYPDINPMPGGAANQILVWAPKHKLERVQQVVDEACKPLPDNQQTVVKSYSLQYIGVEEATAWLKAICPNASFEPLQPGTPRSPSTLPPELQRRRYQRPDDAKVVVVIASPLEHLEIAKALSELDKDMPDSFKMVPKFYSMDDYPAQMFYPLYGSLNRAFPNAVCTPSIERQTMMIVATEDDHKKIAGFIKSFKDDREEKRPSLEVYGLKNLNYYRVSTLISKVAPQATIIPGAKPEQIGIWGTPKDHLDISTALTKLETTSNEKSTQALKLFKVGGKKAPTAAQILAYQFPGSLTFASSADEILSWACPADHAAMAEMLKTVAEAYPDPVLKTYAFKHVPLGEGYSVLTRIYPVAEAAITLRRDTGDLIVSATPETQAKIAKNIEEFDVPRPVETEKLPVAYDLSDIPMAQITYAVQSIRTALPETIILPSGVPGQLVVWGKTVDQEKVRAMVDQMLTERPANSSRMQIYTVNRGSATAATPMLRLIAPNAQFGYGTNIHQLLVWAKEADHKRLQNAIDKLNEADPTVAIETYSLKNIYTTTARTLVTELITTQGLDAKVMFDYYGNQLVVQARSEDQKQIKDLLAKLKSEDRELAVFPLETVDPVTAYRGINTLFIDESYYSSPAVEVDQNTNMLFVQGTKDQLERIRKMLIEMGETQLNRTPSTIQPQTELPKAGQSQLRVIRINGNTSDAIRELEKLWPQYQQNRLLINRQDEPLIQKKEEPKGGAQEPGASAPGWSEPVPTQSIRGLTPPAPEEPSYALFSIDDPVKKDEKPKTDDQMKQVPAPTAIAERLGDKLPSNVYVTVNEDATLTVASYDTEALDRLEQLLKRINDRVVFEGRDYTIYSVRNISATLVGMKLNMILRERLLGQQRRYGSAVPAAYQPPRLEITPDETTNTIYVRGAKAERTEVANLIAMLDVSELPGERAVRKPIKVPIKNTQANRVVQQILNVYQQKMMATRLPGGVYPRVTVDNVTNSVEIIAPEPLCTELKEYAEDLDRRTVEEPARKVHVIPLEVKSQVVRRALQIIQQQSAVGVYPYGMTQPMYPGMMPAYPGVVVPRY